LVLHDREAFSLPRALEVPREDVPLHNYILAEDFPEDKIKVFNNFIRYRPPSEAVNIRLGLNDKVSYEDFLSAVSLAITSVSRNPYDAVFFIENVIKPLSYDLKTKEFRGYRFPVEDLPAFFINHAADVQRVSTLTSRGMVGLSTPRPNEICMAWHYAQAFEAIHSGRPFTVFSNMLDKAFPRPGRAHRLDRPYYFHSDEERHQWFLFVQAELIHSGYIAVANQILDIELEHNRELIVWQLQKRAYLAQRLYEIRDSASLSFLKKLLLQELAGIRNDLALNLNFEKAMDSLRAIDDKVRVEPRQNVFKGVIILPWIDRQDIDRRMGRRMPSEHDMKMRQRLAENRLTLRVALKNIASENIDDETKKAVREMYEWILSYIRALAIINERLYVERSLREITQLHSELVGSGNVSVTEIDSFLFPRRSSSRSEEQRKFDAVRRPIITGHFWHHQRRRQDGDMTVGDIILPWVEVRDEWFEINN